MNRSRSADAATTRPSARRAGRATPSLADFFALLARQPALSGSDLAATLGITRAAVWKRVEQLRALGLPIHAEAGRGYRLDAPIERLDATRIADAIDPARRARMGEIDVHWELDSTSSELARRASTSSAPSACLAEIQTRGRGRRGRGWQMPLGGGIALSCLYRFERGMAELAGLSLAAGVAALRALDDCGVGGVSLKWPNDIVADGRKLGGILVELGGDALGPCHAIVGIGINVRISSTTGVAIDQPWTDLAALTNEAAPSRNLCAGRLLSRLDEAFEQFAVEGFALFAADYARHDALCGHAVNVSRGAETFVATANGVTSRGALKLVRDGVEIEIDSGEASVRRSALRASCNS